MIPHSYYWCVGWGGGGGNSFIIIVNRPNLFARWGVSQSVLLFFHYHLRGAAFVCSRGGQGLQRISTVGATHIISQPAGSVILDDNKPNKNGVVL